MPSRLSSLMTIAALAFVAAISMGNEGCSKDSKTFSEPREFCKTYKAKTDRADCAKYCENNQDFSISSNRAELVRSCQIGQLGYLYIPRITAPEALLGCDRHYSNPDLARACRSGVAAEELRASRGAGTAGGDRETGNHH